MNNFFKGTNNYNIETIHLELNTIRTTRPTFNDLTVYLQRYEGNELYNPKLSLSSIPSGKVGVSFINPPTNKIRNLILRNPVDEALELTYNSQEDNIYIYIFRVEYVKD